MSGGRTRSATDVNRELLARAEAADAHVAELEAQLTAVLDGYGEATASETRYAETLRASEARVTELEAALDTTNARLLKLNHSELCVEVCRVNKPQSRTPWRHPLYPPTPVTNCPHYSHDEPHDFHICVFCNATWKDEACGGHFGDEGRQLHERCNYCQHFRWYHGAYGEGACQALNDDQQSECVCEFWSGPPEKKIP
jgi:hypothetical protein